MENIMWVVSTYIAILILLSVYKRLLEFLRLNLMDSLQDQQDIDKLVEWARNWLGSQGKQLFFSLCIGVMVAIFGFNNNFPLAKFSVGQFFFYLINYFFAAGIGVYGLLSVIFFLLKLNKINLRLYSDDPASSPILKKLSNELGYYIFFIASMGAVLMILLRLVDLLSYGNIIAIVICVWLPIIACFFIGNSVFSQQIARVKYERLEKLQLKIMRLSTIQKIDKGTTEYIKSLMDIHDRIKNTRNSLYNIGSLLNLFGSLLLPPLAAVLNIIAIWERFFTKS